MPSVIEEGQVLDGTYRLVRLVGEGGMGRVFEATHARLAGRYAIKVLLQKLSANPEALRRFDREARITSSLQHPNIVQVIDFNTTQDGTEYLVMEYLRGDSLAVRLARRGSLSLDIVIDIVDQLAAGLSAAHKHGVIHRDLKPDNIFLIPVEGKVTEWAKILDFGISKVSDSQQPPGAPVSALLGTPLYMAPEQCQGRSRDIDAATDQFALAAITYEMLTGCSPFAGRTVGDVLAHVVHDDPPPMCLNAGVAVEAVVRRGLAKSNSQRFPSVTAFADALRSAAAGNVTELHDRGTIAYAVGEVADELRVRARPRHTWGLIMAAAAVVVMASAVVARQARDTLRTGTQPERPAVDGSEASPHEQTSTSLSAATARPDAAGSTEAHGRNVVGRLAANPARDPAFTRPTKDSPEAIAAVAASAAADARGRDPRALPARRADRQPAPPPRRPAAPLPFVPSAPATVPSAPAAVPSAPAAVPSARVVPTTPSWAPGSPTVRPSPPPRALPPVRDPNGEATLPLNESIGDGPVP